MLGEAHLLLLPLVSQSENTLLEIHARDEIRDLQDTFGF